MKVYIKIKILISKKGRKLSQEDLIKELNKIIYKEIGNKKIYISYKAAKKLDYYIYILIYQWSKRKHNNKSKKWIFKKYWRYNENRLSFSDESNILIRVVDIRNRKN